MFWFDAIAIHSFSDLMGSDIRYHSSKEKNKKSIWDHQFTTEEKEMAKKKKNLLNYKYAMYVPYIYLQKYHYLDFG